eukprot:16344-Hanusia_phi.AAC.11
MGMSSWFVSVCCVVCVLVVLAYTEDTPGDTPEDTPEDIIDERRLSDRYRMLDTDEDRAQQIEKRVLLASFPRSGNSMLRSMIEDATGIWTGSDFYARDLSPYTEGEGVWDSRVLFVKTHWPVFRNFRRAKRAVLLVRNPFEVIVSWMHLRITMQHNATLPECIFQLFRDEFTLYAKYMVKSWTLFHEYWLGPAAENVNVMVVRYEDLMGPHRAELLECILQFGMSDNYTIASMQSSFYTPRKKLYQESKYIGNEIRSYAANTTARVACTLGYGREVLGKRWKSLCRQHATFTPAFLLAPSTLHLRPRTFKPTHLNIPFDPDMDMYMLLNSGMLAPMASYYFKYVLI